MPRLHIPHKSSVHRIGAIGLFRALLNASKSAPFPPQDQQSIRNVVRQKFKATRFEQSWRKLSLAFAAGYEALNMLTHAPVGSYNYARTKSLLARIDPSLTCSPVAAPRPSPPAPPVFHPARIPVLARPHRTVSGVRRVPKFIGTGHFYMLRIRKPQSQALSALIRRKQVRQQRLHNVVAELERGVRTAKWEDLWDDEMANTGIAEPREALESVYELEAARSLGFVHRQIAYKVRQAKMHGEKLLDIVQREQLLADKEAAARKAAKRMARLERLRAQTKERGVTGRGADAHGARGDKGAP